MRRCSREMWVSLEAHGQKEEKSKPAPFNRKGAAPNAGTHTRADSSGAEA
jgi:hypothetical protein